MISTWPGLGAREEEGLLGAQGEGACHCASTVGRTTKAIICGNHFTSERKKKTESRQQAAATAPMVSFSRDTREGPACAEICQIKNGKP